jgi:hypothetical protein
MALLQDREAYRSWNALLASCKEMVDLVHCPSKADTFNKIIAPKIRQTVLQFSRIGLEEYKGMNLGTELEQFLAEHHGWNGEEFERLVSAVDLHSSLKCFRLVSEQTLGRGAYARVLLARNQLTGESVVHKHVQLDSAEHGMPLHVLRELSLLKKMRHQHVVRYDLLA